jgi:hypothetical protein
MCNTEIICVWRKNSEQPILHRWWKGYWSRFQEWGCHFRERQLVPFAQQCPCSFCHDSEVSLGELQLYLPDLMPADFFLFPKVKTVLKGRRFQDIEDIKKTNTSTKLNTVPLYTFSNCCVRLWWRHKKVCYSQGRLLWRKTEQFFSYFKCICSCRLSSTT